MWTPISLTELEEWISRGESKLEGEPLKFWNLIKIAPQKWQVKEYGDKGGGFWVVAVLGNAVVFIMISKMGLIFRHIQLMDRLANMHVNNPNLIGS
jgi:hypothetical protein